jgi:hypothetical protein
MTELYFTRAREFDLAPMVQSLVVAFEHFTANTAQASGRGKDDTVLAMHLALAVAAHRLRDAFDLPVEAWAEVNALAANRSSLINLLPTLPFVEELEAGLHSSTKSNG